MNGCGCDFEAENAQQRMTLRIVLAINAFMFLAESLAGWWAGSAGLVADSLDMLADATVYAISLWAIGKAESIRRTAARASGSFQIALGFGVIVEAVRRWSGSAEPLGIAMIGVGAVALIANATCLWLISRHKTHDVSFRASYIFSTNDVIANLGVIVAGLLVHVTDSKHPDLVIAALISIVVIRGGCQILVEANQTADCHVSIDDPASEQ